MVIDTSALIAILLGEPEANAIATAIANDNKRLLSSFSFLEASIVIEARKGESGGRELDLLLHHIQAEVISMNPKQAEVARSPALAWHLFCTFPSCPFVILSVNFLFFEQEISDRKLKKLF